MGLETNLLGRPVPMRNGFGKGEIWRASLMTRYTLIKHNWSQRGLEKKIEDNIWKHIAHIGLDSA